MDLAQIDLSTLSIDQINELQSRAIAEKQERVANAPEEITKLVSDLNALINDVKKSGDAELITRCKTALLNLENFSRKNHSDQEKIDLINQILTKEWQRQSSILSKLRTITSNDNIQIASFKDQLKRLADGREVDVSSDQTDKKVVRWEWKLKPSK